MKRSTSSLLGWISIQIEEARLFDIRTERIRTQAGSPTKLRGFTWNSGSSICMS
uniref:Uncharacterized protein n=1 Tax=Oryza brachyantha TaxID=4533 RepID=J3ND78_ORYBR